jgi:hypothetical protein
MPGLSTGCPIIILAKEHDKRHNKTQPAGGKTAPGHFAKRRPSIQVEKTPEPLPHPYKWHCSTCETINDQGQALDMCFGVVADEGIFSNHSLKIHSHRESNPRPCY